MTTKSNIINLDRGKIPPQAVDIEEVVLGALLISESAIYEVSDILFADVFYKDNHKFIYEVISTFFQESKSIDLLTVSQELKKRNKLESIGGDHYLINLTQKVFGSAHIEYHARIILQKYIQRQIIKTSNYLIEDSYNEDVDVFDLLDNAYNELNKVTEQTIRKSDISFGELVSARIKKGRDIQKGLVLPGISTPISKLTKKTGGWRGGELIILAARPAMGKTAFAIKLGLHAAEQGNPTQIFSLEMSDAKFTDRILSMEGRIDGDKFNIQGLSQEDEEKLKPVQKKMATLPLYIDATSSLSIEKFQVKAKVAKKKHGIKLIIIDYLQLMSGNGKSNREQEISKISRGLKMTAMELDIPIIALSQLSRAVETRGGSKRPMLSDLRESGAIEQDADMVMFLYRPEYYGIEEWDDDDRAPTKDQCEYIVSKNRSGGLVRARMRFEGRYTLFSDLSEPNKQDDKDWFKTELPKPSLDEAFNNSRELPKEKDEDSEVPF